jgi:microcystin degradation protein MlrC
MHETNTFSRVPTDMAMIRRRDYHLENEIPEAFRGTRSAFGATFEAADKFGWSLVHPVSANPNPSGIVTDEAFETIAGMILGAIDMKGPIDGVLLHLHGAPALPASPLGRMVRMRPSSISTAVSGCTLGSTQSITGRS